MEQQSVNSDLHVEHANQESEQSQKEQIFSLRSLGRSVRQIAEAVGVSSTSVHRILSKSEQPVSEEQIGLATAPEPALVRLQRERSEAEQTKTTVQNMLHKAHKDLATTTTAIKEADLQLQRITELAEIARVFDSKEQTVQQAGGLQGRIRELEALLSRTEQHRVVVMDKINQTHGTVREIKTRILNQRRVISNQAARVEELERTLQMARNTLRDEGNQLADLKRELRVLTGEVA